LKPSNEELFPSFW